MFENLVDIFSSPHMDLFAFTSNHKLPLFVLHGTAMEAGGPDAFLVDWSQWSFLYLFPPPAPRVLLQVCHKLLTFQDQVLLVALFWQPQPW